MTFLHYAATVALAVAYGFYGYRRGKKVATETLIDVANASVEFGVEAQTRNIAIVLETLASGEDMNLVLAALASAADVRVDEAADVLRVAAKLLRGEWDPATSAAGLEVVQ
jgi:hypothetical protein